MVVLGIRKIFMKEATFASFRFRGCVGFWQAVKKRKTKINSAKI